MDKESKLNVGFITTVSGRWPRELPRLRDQEYSRWLGENFPGVNLFKPESPISNHAEVEQVIADFRRDQVDLVIVLVGAFTGDHITVLLGEKLGVPIIIWAPREPPFDGGRPIANSLVAATMNQAALRRMGFKSWFVYGDCSEARVQGEIVRYLTVCTAAKRLSHTFLGLLGYRPTAFYSSTFDEILLRKVFGIRMEETDLAVVLDRAKKVGQGLVEKDLESLRATVKIEGLPPEYLENHSRLKLALDAFLAEQGFDALTVKCWPEMGEFGYTPCAVLSRLADRGFIAGCEGDVEATVTMLAQQYLSGEIPFMGDLVTVDETDNTALFWHCGQAAGSLAARDNVPVLTGHGLAGKGAVLESTLKPGPVTIARFFCIDRCYRLFLASGEALPTHKVLKGTMVHVRLDDPVLKTVYRLAAEGVPHHYSLVWRDIAGEMRDLCALLGIDVLTV